MLSITYRPVIIIAGYCQDDEVEGDKGRYTFRRIIAPSNVSVSCQYGTLNNVNNLITRECKKVSVGAEWGPLDLSICMTKTTQELNELDKVCNCFDKSHYETPFCN